MRPAIFSGGTNGDQAAEEGEAGFGPGREGPPEYRWRDYREGEEGRGCRPSGVREEIRRVRASRLSRLSGGGGGGGGSPPPGGEGRAGFRDEAGGGIRRGAEVLHGSLRERALPGDEDGAQGRPRGIVRLLRPRGTLSVPHGGRDVRHARQGGGREENRGLQFPRPRGKDQRRHLVHAP